MVRNGDRRTRVTLSWNPGPAMKRHPWASLAIGAALAAGTAALNYCGAHNWQLTGPSAPQEGPQSAP